MRVLQRPLSCTLVQDVNKAILFHCSLDNIC
uniref:Uncharacterized protein n=1 Tax=Arundo donax TaxID=35708 RepID=A0A0A9HF22_ARUDO